MIAVAFAIGIGLSLRADSNDPDAEEKREERMEHMKETHTGTRSRALSAPRPSERRRASWRSSAPSRSSHCPPISAIHATASDIGSGVGR